MNKLLTKKVEELTLYLIGKDDQIKKEQLKSKNLQDQLEVEKELLESQSKRIKNIEKKLGISDN